MDVIVITGALALAVVGIVALINRWVRKMEDAVRRDTEPPSDQEQRRREFVAAAVVSRRRFRGNGQA